MNIFRAFALSSIALFCASAGAGDTRGMAALFPAELGGFVRGEPIDFESKDPGLGIGLPYNHPGVKATVYVYDLQSADLPDGIGSREARDEVGKAEGDVSRSYKDVRVLSASDVYSSHLYLAIRNGNFVKVRVTYAEGSGVSDRDAAHERFAQALCRFAGG